MRHAGEPPCDIGWLPDEADICRFCGAACQPNCNEPFAQPCPEGTICSSDDPDVPDAECIGALRLLPAVRCGRVPLPLPVACCLSW